LLSMMQELAQGIVDERWLWLHAGIVVLCTFAAMVVIDPRARTQRWIQLGMLGVLVVHVTIFGFRHAHRRDWTQGRVYSLSERAQAVLGAIDTPIDVQVLMPTTIGGGRPNPLDQELREVLRRMAGVAPSLRVRFVDPDRDRQHAEQLVAQWGLSGRDLADGVVLVRAGQGARMRKEHLWPGDLVTYATGPDVQATGPRVEEFRGEEALLGAFVRVTNPVEITVCHTQGHGEPRFDSLEPFAGYAHLRDLLTDASLNVRVADLDMAGGLDGCDVVLVAGPGGALPAAHVEAIERYAEAGGDLLLLTGAVVVPGGEGLAPHGLEPLLRRHGIDMGERLVLDPHEMPGATPLLAFTLVEGWGDHPAVHSLLGRPVSFVFARELALVPGDVEAQPLVSSSEASWAEAGIEGIRAGELPELDDGVDRPGPIVLAAAAERGGSRVVVVGSDQFALNAYLREDIAYDFGRDLILNAIGWITERDVLLGIRPRPREHVKLVLRPEQLRRMTLVCLVGLPGFAMALGFWVLWRRRR
jgi:ABC-2 type transport system permease protein